jgi:hypothetical protein
MHAAPRMIDIDISPPGCSWGRKLVHACQSMQAGMGT